MTRGGTRSDAPPIICGWATCKDISDTCDNALVVEPRVPAVKIAGIM